jgi:hypothetical protein
MAIARRPINLAPSRHKHAPVSAEADLGREPGTAPLERRSEHDWVGDNITRSHQKMQCPTVTHTTRCLKGLVIPCLCRRSVQQ